MKARKMVAVAFAAVLVLAACGDDDDDDGAPTAGASGDAEAYCEASAALDEQDDFPSDDQLAELADLAPEEIAADVDAAAEILIEEGPDAFGDADLNASIETIEAWEEENCPHRAGDDDEEDESGAPQEPDPDATVVDVTATEYEFAIEGDVKSGKVAFVMQNDGEEPHHMGLVRLQDGTTEEDAEEASEAGLGAIEALVDEQLGNSSDAEPGDTSVLNAELSPGVYGMGCFVDAPDGQPHFSHGMRIFFTVS